MSTTPEEIVRDTKGADLVVLDMQGTALVQHASLAMQIVDAETYQAAAEFLRLVKAYIAEVDAFMSPICESAHKAWKTAVARRDGLKSCPLQAETMVKGRMAAWQAEQERLRREAEEAARKERERLQREEQARVDAERRRLQAAAEEQRLQAALEAEKRGDVQAAEQLIAAPIVTAPVLARPVFLPPVAPSAAPKVEGVSYREEWDYVVEDASLIPREYLMLNEVALRKVCKALKGATRIPGIRAVSRTVTAVKA